MTKNSGFWCSRSRAKHAPLTLHCQSGVQPWQAKDPGVGSCNWRDDRRQICSIKLAGKNGTRQSHRKYWRRFRNNNQSQETEEIVTKQILDLSMKLEEEWRRQKTNYRQQRNLFWNKNSKEVKRPSTHSDEVADPATTCKYNINWIYEWQTLTEQETTNIGWNTAQSCFVQVQMENQWHRRVSLKIQNNQNAVNQGKHRYSNRRLRKQYVHWWMENLEG